mmetsp:Transcript_22664/g.53617  ORF Transcript_22664/g.53617 Transcript_22664/m.53617 type:complete len:437 (+) Transcript_22664:2-1312(+)
MLELPFFRGPCEQLILVHSEAAIRPFEDVQFDPELMMEEIIAALRAATLEVRLAPGQDGQEMAFTLQCVSKGTSAGTSIAFTIQLKTMDAMDDSSVNDDGDDEELGDDDETENSSILTGATPLVSPDRQPPHPPNIDDDPTLSLPAAVTAAAATPADDTASPNPKALDTRDSGEQQPTPTPSTPERDKEWVLHIDLLSGQSWRFSKVIMHLMQMNFTCARLEILQSTMETPLKRTESAALRRQMSGSALPSPSKKTTRSIPSSPGSKKDGASPLQLVSEDRTMSTPNLLSPMQPKTLTRMSSFPEASPTSAPDTVWGSELSRVASCPPVTVAEDITVDIAPDSALRLSLDEVPSPSPLASPDPVDFDSPKLLSPPRSRDDMGKQLEKQDDKGEKQEKQEKQEEKQEEKGEKQDQKQEEEQDALQGDMPDETQEDRV